MGFENLSTTEFNTILETNLQKGMTFSQAVDEIEKEDIQYFYVSAAKDDVEQAIRAEDGLLIKQLNLWLVYVEQIGVCIAIQQ